MKHIGTIVRGIKTPIIKEGDNLEDIVVTALQEASQEGNFSFHDRDVVAITEAVVGISDGNYATVDDVAFDVNQKFTGDHLGIVFPILSRNRFALILKGIARAKKKLTILLSFPADEVGNDILNKEKLVHSLSDTFGLTEYYENYGEFKHLFTGINMVDFYKELVEQENCEVDFIFSNDSTQILAVTNQVLVCDIHTRFDTKESLYEADVVLGLDDILTDSIHGSGCNETYGLLGSNRATEEKLKLFPNNQQLVFNIQNRLKELTGKTIEVMIYGDGAFKDPIGKIWELADPVVSPSHTKGLEGSPNELKLKYLSDAKLAHLTGEELSKAVKQEILNKDYNLKGKMETQGTTPRRYVDLLGSLCDLTSGSGDKGTPVVLVQNYFNNYASEGDDE